MSRRFVLLAVLAVFARPASTTAETPRGDVFGDPLPPGATARLGTVRFRQSGTAVRTLLFSPDGRRLLSGDGSRLYLWDSATGRRAVEIERVEYAAGSSHVFSGDGKTVSAIGGRTLRVWDTATGRHLRQATAGSPPARESAL